MIIDAHQHFWTYDADAYPWIPPGILAGDHGPQHLRPLLDQAGVSGCIAVQARQCSAETTWLCDLATTHPWIVGVVGWVDLRADDCRAHLERARHPALVGLRHVIQDEPDDRFIMDSAFNRGVALATDSGLAYDILVYPRQLEHVPTFADRHPHARLILDHAGKPPLWQGDLTTWAHTLSRIAERPHVACKVSGLVTEADHAHWRRDDIIRVLDHALACFGAERLLFGSDWPVCTLATPYTTWHTLVHAWAQRLSPNEQAAIFGGTACHWYHVKATTHARHSH